MSEIKSPSRPMRRGRSRELGVAAVELALVSLVFFTVVFGAIELARLMYLCNTLQEVTRRAASAAANTDFTNATAMQGIRQAAIFQDSAGTLALSQHVTDQSIRIDYMTIQNAGGTLTTVPIPTGSLPSSPTENRRTCLIDPSAPSCIRIVRVRVCASAIADNCVAVRFQSIVPLINLSVSLPLATTLVRAESLGFVPPTPPGS
ncbi:MAG: TadE/TadG family type IV pilus assembly protein [Massilia sp.]